MSRRIIHRMWTRTSSFRATARPVLMNQAPPPGRAIARTDLYRCPVPRGSRMVAPARRPPKPERPRRPPAAGPTPHRTALLLVEPRGLLLDGRGLDLVARPLHPEPRVPRLAAPHPHLVD